MKFFDQASLKLKQMIVILLTTGIALLLACAAFGTYEVIAFHRSMVENLSTLADIVGNNTSAAIEFENAEDAAAKLSTLKAEPNIVGASVYTASGTIFATYNRGDDGLEFTPPAAPPAGHVFKAHRLRLAAPIVQKGETVGAIYLESDMAALDARLQRYAAIAGGVFLLALLAALGLSSQLQHLVSEPLLQLVQTARIVARDKDYSVRVTGRSRDEIGVLINGFNEMLTEIQKRDAVLQQAQAKLEQRVADRTRELAGSLSLLHATLESTADGILVADGGGRIANCNEKFARMWRIPDEVIRAGDEQRMIDIAAPQLKDPQQFLGRIVELYGHPEEESFEVLEFTDGRVFERYSKPQRVGDKSVGRVWSFRDVTERKQAEAELAYERDLLGTFLDNSPDFIYFKDRESRFLRCSKSLFDRFGLCEADFVGKTDFDLYGEEHARLAFEDEHRILSTGKPIIGKVEKEVWKDQRSTWVLTSKLPLYDKGGVIIGTFGISKDITAIKEAETRLELAHKQLLETSRMAGMAEVATSVLHNVGNVLNSVNVSGSIVSDRVRRSRVAYLAKAVEMLQKHEADLPAFLSTDPKGRQLPAFLATLSGHLADEQQELLRELKSLTSNIDHIKEIVAMQQSYAKVAGVMELLPVVDLVEDAVRINAGALERHKVMVVRDYTEVPPSLLDKHKLLQILINLIRNAKYALDEGDPPEKRLTLRVRKSANGRMAISVMDNGVGIPPENMTRIFGLGFTTRKEGHGFGLHNGALAAREMGGSLTAHSDGPGAGAAFVLELPCHTEENSHD